MKEYTFVPIADFKRSEAEGTYYIIDLVESEISSCNCNCDIDVVFEMIETKDIYVAYKEKSPCGNTD